MHDQRLELITLPQGNIIFHPNIRVAWLPQKDTLYPWLSIIDNVQLENVLFGNKSTKTTLQAKALLEQVGMSEHLHKSCAQLSGGQKQRCAVARALITQPRLVLADEPTGALDSKAANALLDVFGEINRQGQTILMVTHSAQAASRASRVLFIKDGEVFHQIYRGEKTKEEMYQMISDTLTILMTGGEYHA